jgi:fatty acid-binding protein DegV
MGENCMLHIVTDGAVDLPPEWEEEFQIDAIPINVQFVEKTYSCRVSEEV